MQLLDGVGAGLFGALFPLIVADLMGGTGRFNVALGAVITAQGIGASLSTTLAGLIVVQAGYSAAFPHACGRRASGCSGFLFAMPETLGHPWKKSGGGQSQEPARASTVVLHPIA